MFKTITAKYSGTCRRCNGPIAIGQKMRYGGPRQTWHLRAECGVQDDDQDAGAQVEPVTAQATVYSQSRGAAGWQPLEDLQPSPLESSPDAAGEWAIDARMAAAAPLAARDAFRF